MYHEHEQYRTDEKKKGGGYYGVFNMQQSVGKNIPKREKKGNSEMDKMSFVLDPGSRAAEWSVV